MATYSRNGRGRMPTQVNRGLSANLRPHELYMKMTALEIERARRNTEKEANEYRLKIINDRIRDIESQQSEIKERLAHLEDDPANGSSGSVQSVQNRQLRY